MLNPNLIAISLLISVLATAPGNAWAFCNKELPETTLASRFIISGDNVYEKKTKLTWSRCPVGMKWRKNKCDGSPRLMNFVDAQEFAK